MVSCVLETPSENPLEVSSRKCLTKIVSDYVIFRPTLSIYTTNLARDGIVLKDIYKSNTYPKKLFNFTSFKLNFFEVRKNYTIVLGNTLKEFLSQPKVIEKFALRNARARYIFYTFKSNEENIKEFINFVWYYYIVNAVIVMPADDEEKMLNIFSWFPYEDKQCGVNIASKLVSTCIDGVYSNGVNLFPQKVPKNLNGCPVIIRTLIWPPFVLPPEDGHVVDGKILNITEGIEVRLLQAIGKIANYTPYFTSSTVPHDWGLATVDGNLTGAVKALKEKKADLAIGSFGPTTERRMYCDHSACHLQEMLTWCVPKAQEAPRWKNLMQTFTLTAWLAMILMYIFVSTVIWMLSYCPPKDITNYRKIKASFIYIFSAFLGLSASETPAKTSSRISFFVWLVFGLHFVVAYQAKLIGVLLRPSYERQISSVAEVLKSGMEYEILPTHRRFYANTEDWKVAKIVKEWKSCHDSDACLRRVAYKRDFALCTLKAHADFESLQYRDSDGQPLVHCIPYVTYTSEIYMTKGFPLKDRIDKMIYKIRDSGLIFKWQRDIQRTWLYRYRNTIPSEDSKQNVLSISHLQGAFGILFTGLTISFFIFIVEQGTHKYKQSQLKCM